MEVRRIPNQQTHEWLLKKHYAHRIPIIIISYGLYSDNIMVGICTFGPPCKAYNDGEFIFNDFKVKTMELNRLCVNDDLPSNSTSWFIGQIFKLLPKPLCLVSYSDESFGHKGYIYQATNWLYTGCNEVHDVEYFIGGKQVHSRTLTSMKITAPQQWAEQNNIETTDCGKKHRYFKFLGNKPQIKEMRAKFRFNVISYPKGETKRYNADYQPSVQAVMI
jgi:hypothetical protein